MVKRRWAFAALLSLLSVNASASFDADLQTRLLSAIGALGKSQNADAADFLAGRIVNTAYSVEDWQSLFRTYFKNGGFGSGHIRFWDYAISNTAGPVQTRTGLISGFWAAEAIGASMGPGASGDPDAFGSLSAGFDWLARIAPGLGPNGRTAVFTGLTAAAGNQNVAALSMSPQQYGIYVQYGLILREYGWGSPKAREAVSKMMGFQDAARLFWESRGMLLFDNGALDARQLSSLDLLLTVIPSELHNIGALIVPEATGINPAAGAFVTPAQILYLEPIPMGRMTDPQEFPDQCGHPVAPLFTISAASNIVRAIQQVQFARRPDLRARRDIILANARGKRERFLRRFQIVPPQVYLNDPDALLPSVAFPYFIDSSRAFHMGMLLFELEKQEAIDSFLLMADMMSGGANTTVLYATDPMGRVARSQAPIVRTHLSRIQAPPIDDFGFAGAVGPANLMFCNGIGINGYTYTFELDPLGISIRVFRR